MLIMPLSVSATSRETNALRAEERMPYEPRNGYSTFRCPRTNVLRAEEWRSYVEPSPVAGDYPSGAAM